MKDSKVKQVLRTLLDRFLGLSVYRTLPRGIDVARDIRHLAPSYEPEIVFDIGAHLGDVAARFKKAFPLASIICFEPSPTTFEHLKRNVGMLDNVRCEEIALGEIDGYCKLLAKGMSTKNRLLSGKEKGAIGDIVQVELRSVESYCRSRRIGKIGFLKIDAEGTDFAVLRGARSMLSEHKIDFVQVEVSCNPENDFHPKQYDVTNYLECLGYRVFGFYEQFHERQTRELKLRRCDVVFCSETLIEKFPWSRPG